MPDIQDRLQTKYADQGVEIVAIDPNGDPVEGVRDFVANSGATYPIGLEDPETGTYKELVKNFRGLNPYPVDVVVGKDGKVAYIGREYDPLALEAAVQAELAKD